MFETTLLTTLHDSSGWSIEAISETSKFLDNCYNAKITLLTKTTQKLVIDKLEDYGWDISITKSEVGVSHISDSRKKLLD